MLGVRGQQGRRGLIEALYRELRDMFEAIRQKEEKAAEFKKRAKRKTRLTPRDIARQILRDIAENEPRWFRGFGGFIPSGCDLDSYELPEKGSPALVSDMFEKSGLRFGRKHLISVRSTSQAELLLEAWHAGIRGQVSVPRDSMIFREALGDWLKFAADREQRARALAAERTADEEMQEGIIEELDKLLMRRRTARSR